MKQTYALLENKPEKGFSTQPFLHKQHFSETPYIGKVLRPYTKASTKITFAASCFQQKFFEK